MAKGGTAMGKVSKVEATKREVCKPRGIGVCRREVLISIDGVKEWWCYLRLFRCLTIHKYDTICRIQEISGSKHISLNR